MTLPWVTQLVFGIIDTEFMRWDFISYNWTCHQNSNFRDELERANLSWTFRENSNFKEGVDLERILGPHFCQICNAPKTRKKSF